jgi:uncharacterized linocin/CFP29 family protein
MSNSISPETHVWYQIDKAARTLFRSQVPREGFLSVPRVGAEYDVEAYARDVFLYEVKDV